jgi:predicted NodU family carbamoyl transferase
MPAASTVEYSVRFYSVSKNTNKYYYNLISKFKKKTDYSLILI